MEIIGNIRKSNLSHCVHFEKKHLSSMIRFCLKEIICQDVLWIIDLYNVQQKSLGRGSDHFIQFVLYRPLLGT